MFLKFCVCVFLRNVWNRKGTDLRKSENMLSLRLSGKRNQELFQKRMHSSCLGEERKISKARFNRKFLRDWCVAGCPSAAILARYLQGIVPRAPTLLTPPHLGPSLNWMKTDNRETSLAPSAGQSSPDVLQMVPWKAAGNRVPTVLSILSNNKWDPYYIKWLMQRVLLAPSTCSLTLPGLLTC